MYARALARGFERELAEVSGYESRHDILEAALAPAHEILGRHEDPPVARLAAARPAAEAIELAFGLCHAPTMDCPRRRVEASLEESKMLVNPRD